MQLVFGGPGGRTLFTLTHHAPYRLPPDDLPLPDRAAVRSDRLNSGGRNWRPSPDQTDIFFSDITLALGTQGRRKTREDKLETAECTTAC